MNKIFPLPEIEGSAYISTKTGSLFLGGHITSHRSIQVKLLTYMPHGDPVITNYTITAHFQDGSKCSFVLALQKAGSFDYWLAHFGVYMLDARKHPAPVPALTPAPVPSTCPVCFGTGFYKGFGAPCSKGCK